MKTTNPSGELGNHCGDVPRSEQAGESLPSTNHGGVVAVQSTARAVLDPRAVVQDVIAPA